MRNRFEARTAAGGELESGDGRAAPPVRFAGLSSVGWPVSVLHCWSDRPLMTCDRPFWLNAHSLVEQEAEYYRGLGTLVPLYLTGSFGLVSFGAVRSAQGVDVRQRRYQFRPSTGVRGWRYCWIVESPRSCDRGLVMNDSAGGDQPLPYRFAFANASVPIEDTRINPNRSGIGSAGGGSGIAVSG
jgi:hypothetical protein